MNARAPSLVLLALLCSGCPAPGSSAPPVDTRPPAPVAQPAAPAPVSSDAVTQRFMLDATTIAKQYTAWGRIDDEARWAPYLCRMPMPARARFSQSEDPRTHGLKLYPLYAKDPKAYAGMPASAFPKKAPKLDRYEQVLVKEAWVPEKVEGKVPAGHAGGWYGKSGLRPAVKDGVAYGANRRAGLYLMFRLAKDQDRTGTDKGWVYATIATNGTVTAAGKVASCMECHVDADGKGGRLFGLDPEGKEKAGG